MVVAGRFGPLAVSGNVDHVLDTAVYLIGAEAYNLDLSRLGLGDTLITDINLAVDIEGRGVTPETAAGRLEGTKKGDRRRGPLKLLMERFEG